MGEGMTDTYYISIITFHGDDATCEVRERYEARPELINAIRNGLGIVRRLTDD